MIGSWAFSSDDKPKAVKPDRAQAERFAGLLFDGMTGFVNLRGIEEPAPGDRRGQVQQSWLPIDPQLPTAIGDYVEACAAAGLAAYLLPHPVAEGGGGLKDILAQRVIPVDIDAGDVGAKVAALTAALGEPWLSVESGGLVEGQPKRHLYLRLANDAGPADFPLVADLRERIAQTYGADLKVGKNPAQILRVPGSVWAKSGRRACRLDAVSNNQHSLARLQEVLGGMPQSASNVLPFSFDFSRDALPASIDRVLLQPILAEGKSDDGLTRFEGATMAFGHLWRQVRDGRISADEGLRAALEWNAYVPQPAWSEDRVHQEWARLGKVDVANHGPLPAPRATAGEWARFDDWTGAKFVGTPTPRRYLIDGVLPLGVPGIVAASGGLGKSFLMLDLALRIATGAPRQPFDMNKEQLIFGGEVREFGTAVLFGAEDDQHTLHERLAALDPSGKRKTARLRPIPLPDAGGARALFAADRVGYKTTAEFDAVRAWLKSLDDLRLVAFDPLQSLVAADITSKPEAGQFVMGTLGTLATELGATVLVTHHMKKTDNPISSPEEARAAMRGTSALADGVRWVYALWDAPNSDAGSAASGAVVKANGKTDTSVHRYERLPFGVLRQMPREFDPDAREERMRVLVDAIAAAAKDGRPFTMTGANGLFEQQHRLPMPFKTMPRAGLELVARHALKEGRLVKGTARGTQQRNILDVPEGDFALGGGVLMSGAGGLEAA